MNLPNFPKKCMKLRKFRVVGAEGERGWAPGRHCSGSPTSGGLSG